MGIHSECIAVFKDFVEISGKQERHWSNKARFSPMASRKRMTRQRGIIQL